MRFLADENCDFAVIRALRDANHDVSAVKDELPGGSDQAVIALAIEESRVVLTEDKDFGQLAFASSASPSGVILMRFPATARAAMAETVRQFIEQNAEKIAGNFAVVQPGRARIVRMS
jgi:predicted nuclease of predicted toxin-antitoxin system